MKQKKKASRKISPDVNIRSWKNPDVGSHSPLALRNVGPGYDDTGKGDYAKNKETDNSNKPKNQDTRSIKHK